MNIFLHNQPITSSAQDPYVNLGWSILSRAFNSLFSPINLRAHDDSVTVSNSMQFVQALSWFFSRNVGVTEYRIKRGGGLARPIGYIELCEFLRLNPKAGLTQVKIINAARRRLLDSLKRRAHREGTRILAMPHCYQKQTEADGTRIFHYAPYELKAAYKEQAMKLIDNVDIDNLNANGDVDCANENNVKFPTVRKVKKQKRGLTVKHQNLNPVIPVALKDRRISLAQFGMRSSTRFGKSVELSGLNNSRHNAPRSL